MHEIIHRHTKSFGHAWEGVLFAFRTQPNFVIHVFLSLLAVTSGLALHVSVGEMLVIVVVIVGGLSFELVNTAIEATCDAIDTQHRDEIKIAKDSAASAMLVYALGALVVAGIIFIPRIILLLGF
ncbi:hypothetical protein A3D80_00215 [Candidatus Roizmanbacteria bacterium RIFCSPHIGHO2_02_FULL_40_13b]|uniref:Diacylglycerol kinase n=1 Tax=Candidatus Roizmanbacteria bacterium RIFCSPHIGHO2_01_FULL_39_24 TaxID=1802032 RepID=A0A1F7GKV4_9BACT|nr:MAG: hypothetical protein A2799_00505 [Candidatus Roizmanbacteria bacterium RIFCSPHIGHO2_01_FULL_39_24]OGK28059.1 MAG: hypothetical protein A3D80_00215 [Candidatus Roizmanbacteria bacterium RIFCSPHIGHO2_02_FULL_40_13b]OGK49568.1 MAG: hypothetical protein A3A56_04185 [Candidatus Roizmanbacteria bacterium RIFCSPLOWO2_01_FULL_40_32]